LEHADNYETQLKVYCGESRVPLAENMQHLRRRLSNTWKVHLLGFGHDKPKICRISHISLEMLPSTTSMDSEEVYHLENLFGLLQVTDATPLGFSKHMKLNDISRKSNL